MATEGGGKMKLKRQNADSRPYGRRPSLLGRMKNTVKDMLAPSWVIDLVNGVRKTSPKHHQESEPLQHEPDEEIPVTRTLNRMSPEDGMMQNATNALPHNTATPTAPANPMSYTTQQMPYNAYRPPAPIPQHIMTNGDDQSDASDYSVATSVCSSMIPQPDRKDYQGDIIQMNDSHLRQMQQHMEMRTMPPTVHNTSNVDVANSSTSSAIEGSFLWSSSKPRASKPQPPAKSQMPSFNTSLLSPSKGDKSVYHQSQYYPGKTTFGGAATYRKARIKQSPMPYEPSPLRKQVQARPLNNSPLGGVTSSTAKRILDALERMSTPLSDAKKIPLDGNLSNSVLSMTPGTYRKRRTPNTSLSQSVNDGPPTSRRTLSSFASIATNVHSYPKITPSTQVKSIDGASKSVTTGPEGSYQMGSMDGGGSRSGKMKRERGTHYSSRQAEDEEVEVPNLSTSFVLPVTNFSLPALSGGFGVITPSADDKCSTISSSAATNSTTSSPVFSFSSPIVKSSTADSNTPIINTQFQFSTPITVDPATSKSTKSPPTSGFTFTPSSVTPKMKPPAVNFKAPVESGGGFKPAAELKSGSVMDILGKKTPSELKSASVMDVLGKPTPNGNIGGIQPALEMKTGSVMDILAKSSSGTSGGTNSLGFHKPASSGWTCGTCLIQNKSDVSACIACETPKPQTKPAPAPASAAPLSSGTSSLSFHKTALTCWTCETCLINNKSDVPACVACETPKPRAKPSPASTSTISSSSSGGLSHLLKQSGGDWTCDTCLIQNKPDKSKCVACETPKPQVAPPSTVLSSNSVVASSTQADIKPFQFGNVTKKASGWECDTCLVSNTAETNKCVACEMPRPGAQPPTGFTSTGGFSFSVGGSSSSSSPAAPATTPSAAGFSFGNPTTTASKPESLVPGGFSYGGASEKTDDQKSAGSTSGFKFDVGTSSNAAKLKSDEAKPAFGGTGGFKFGGPTTESAGSNEEEKSKSTAFGGFKFGGTVTKTTPCENNATGAGTAPTGGFQFGQSVKSGAAEEKTPATTTASSVDYQFGQTSEKTSSEKSAAPADASLFKFGQAKDANANVSKPLGAGSTGGFGGFSNNTLKTDSPAHSFQYNAKPTDSANSKEAGKDTANPVFGATKTTETSTAVFGAGATVDKPAASTGGFQFGSGSTAPSLTSGGFAFEANGVSRTKTEEKPTAAVSVFTFGTPNNSTETKAAPFAFGVDTAAKPAESSGQLPAPSFSFKATGPPMSSTTSPGKRGRDDMESGSDAKKPSVSFAAATPSYNSGFKFGDAKPADETAAPTSSFTFGQTDTSTAFGTNNSTNNNTTGGFGGFSSGNAATTTSSVFVAPVQRAVFGNSAPSTTTTFGSAAPAPAFGVPTTTAASSGGMNLTAPTSFTFGTAASTAPSSGVFQFSANNQGNTAPSADGASTNFAFGQGGAPTQPTAPAAATPAPTFSVTPSFNFTGSAGSGQSAVFTAGSSTPAGQNAVFGFNATSGAAAGTGNPFDATSAANANNPRRFKKAVRKLRK